MMNFEEMNKYNKDAMQTMMKSYATAAKNLHSIADEVADFSKKSFAANMAHVEKSCLQKIWKLRWKFKVLLPRLPWKVS